MRILHTADLHFSPKEDKLAEVIRCSDAILEAAHANPPDVAILAGDTVDEHDGRIRLDSPTARAAIRFVRELAEAAPVLIIRGTPSHDREAPYIFREIRARHEIHVGTEIGMIGLFRGTAGTFWGRLDLGRSGLLAAFSLLPSVEKVWLMAHGAGSIREANATAREAIHDVFRGFGLVNETLAVPRILVAHGMVTGARLSSGITAIGEDLEFGLSDIAAAKVDYAALGHVHESQAWGITDDGTAAGRLLTRAAYSGSPGRLNFGELGPKGWLEVEMDGAAPPRPEGLTFHLTPARRFVFGEATWGEAGADGIRAEVARLAAEDLTGADVRFRFAVPEEHLHEIDPDDVRMWLLAAGAREVKVERSVIPRERVRAAGISRLETLPQKVAKWGETVGTEIPVPVLSLAAAIEGLDPEEIAAEALARVDRVAGAGEEIAAEEGTRPDDAHPGECLGGFVEEPDPFAAPPPAVLVDRRERILGAIDGFAVRQEEEAARAVAAMRGPVQESMF
jgi:exonuclease SbcD